MEWLVAEGRRGAGIGVDSYYLVRLIPPTFSCHHGALLFQFLTEMIFATSRTFTFHSLNSQHSLMAKTFFLARVLHLPQLHLPSTTYYVHTVHIHISICLCILRLHQAVPKSKLESIILSIVIQTRSTHFHLLHFLRSPPDGIHSSCLTSSSTGKAMRRTCDDNGSASLSASGSHGRYSQVSRVLPNNHLKDILCSLVP